MLQPVGTEIVMQEPTRRSRLVMVALWPSFLMAGVLEALVFSVVDPQALGAPAQLSATAVYTLGFLCFWAATGLASGLSLLLADLPSRA